MTQKEVTPKPKPMSRDERRVLEKLVKGDMELLQQEFNREFGIRYESEKAAVKSKYAGREEETMDASRQVRDLVEKFRQDYENLINSLREQGRVLMVNNTSSTYPRIEVAQTFTIAGMHEELAALDRKFAQMRAAGSTALHRQSNEFTRKILLSTIVSEEANELLESIPSVAEILDRAASSIPALNGGTE